MLFRGCCCCAELWWKTKRYAAVMDGFLLLYKVVVVWRDGSLPNLFNHRNTSIEIVWFVFIFALII